MTRKDYIKIANIIRKTEAYENEHFFHELIDMFQDDNPRFDMQRFINACIVRAEEA